MGTPIATIWDGEHPAYRVFTDRRLYRVGEEGSADPLLDPVPPITDPETYPVQLLDTALDELEFARMQLKNRRELDEKAGYTKGLRWVLSFLKLDIINSVEDAIALVEFELHVTEQGRENTDGRD